MKRLVALCLLCFALPAGPATARSCQNWNTENFFKTATPAVVTDCVQAGADPKARDTWGLTPLHWAASGNSNPAIITTLLDADADLEAQAKWGKATPLHAAASNTRNPAVVAALLDAGADPTVRVKDGRTPLHYAVSNHPPPVVVIALLDAGAELDARDEAGRTPLHWARDPVAAMALLDAGAALHARDIYDLTPLHVTASSTGSPKVVSVLLRAGADPNALTASGVAPLYLASRILVTLTRSSPC